MRYLNLRIPIPDLRGVLRLRSWLPSRGNALFTLLVVAGLLWATSAGAIPLRAPAAAGTSTGTIAYQGRLADSAGDPLTGTYNMIFRLYDTAAGGTPLWEEQWTGSNGVKVSDGLFNVMLGSLTQIPMDVVTGHDTLWLGITVGSDDEMTPRVQLGSVPFAVQALTVPDGSITTDKLNLAEGDVGIGTTSPNAKLDVNGTMRAISQVAPTSGIGTEIAWDGSRGVLRVFDRTNGLYKPLSIGGSTVNIGGATGGSGTENGGIHVATSGDVGIGTESPGAKLDVNGDLHVTGTKSAVVQAGEFGQRKLYAVEAPDVRFSDEGLAQLEDGIARVTLDPVFLATIEGDYLVHVTPYGDASLYVAEIGEDYFVVKARDGNPNVAFAWRLSAHRKGYDGIRLETVTQDNADSVQ